MANLLARMKTYNFWISFVSAIILVLRIIGDKFNFFVDATLIMDITTGLCGIFVVLGIISAPSGKKEETKVEGTNIGRFETIKAENESLNETENILSNENDEEVETSICEENEDLEGVKEDVVLELEEVEKIDAIVQNSTLNVENCEIVEEKIQSTIENNNDVTENKAEEKAEIIELLTVLLEKFQNM